MLYLGLLTTTDQGYTFLKLLFEISRPLNQANVYVSCYSLLEILFDSYRALNNASTNKSYHTRQPHNTNLVIINKIWRKQTQTRIYNN